MAVYQPLTIFCQRGIGLLLDQLTHLFLMAYLQSGAASATVRLGGNRPGLSLPAAQLGDKRQADLKRFSHFPLRHFFASRQNPRPQVYRIGVHAAPPWCLSTPSWCANPYIVHSIENRSSRAAKMEPANR
jgi:hypothetical protein